MLGIVRGVCLSGVCLFLLGSSLFNTQEKDIINRSVEARNISSYISVAELAKPGVKFNEVKSLSNYISEDIVLVNYAGLETITTEVSTEVTTLSNESKEAKLVLGDDVVYGSRGVPVGIDTSFKSYMDYRTITSKSSNQYKLQVHPDVYTDDEGFRRYKDCYIVAVGTYYTNRVGTLLEVELGNGNIIKCLVGDIKQDRHTDSLNQHRNGNVIEFIVDTDKLPDIVKKMGDVSYAPIANLHGNVVGINVINPLDSDTTVNTNTIVSTETTTSDVISESTTSELTSGVVSETVTSELSSDVVSESTTSELSSEVMEAKGVIIGGLNE